MGRGSNFQKENNYLYQGIAPVSTETLYSEELDSALLFIKYADWHDLQSLLKEHWLLLPEVQRKIISDKLAERLIDQELPKSNEYYLLNGHLNFIDHSKLKNQDYKLASQALTESLNTQEINLFEGFPKALLSINNKFFSKELMLSFQEQALFVSYDKYRQNYPPSLEIDNQNNRQQIEDADRVYQLMFSVKTKQRNDYWKKINTKLSAVACNHYSSILSYLHYLNLPKHDFIPESPNYAIYVDHYSAYGHYIRNGQKKTVCQIKREYCLPAKYTGFQDSGLGLSWDQETELRKCPDCNSAYIRDLVDDRLLSKRQEMENDLSFALDANNHYLKLANILEQETETKEEKMTAKITDILQNLIQNSVQEILQRNRELLNADSNATSKLSFANSQEVR
jgi:hypothetical protein